MHFIMKTMLNIEGKKAAAAKWTNTRWNKPNQLFDCVLWEMWSIYSVIDVTIVI